MRRYFILFTCLFLTLSVYAQPASEPVIVGKEKVKNLSLRNRIQRGEYLHALKLLHKEVKKNPLDPYLNYYLGVCYFSSGWYLESLPYLQTANELSPDLEPDLHYYLGRAHHFNADFTEAIFHLKKELDRYMELDSLYRVTKRLIRQCELGKYFYDHPTPTKVLNLGSNVNSKFPEYSSTYIYDEDSAIRKMFYTSRRPRGKHRLYFRMNYGFYYHDDILEETFYSEGKNNVWKKSNKAPKTIRKLKHDASITYRGDQDKLYFYLDVNGGDIFYIQKEGKDKEKRVSIGDSINTPYNEPSMFLNKAGNVLYYVSDKPGGYGGLDLYVSYLHPDGQWSQGTNLGPVINTEYDEDAPFLSDDGKVLYFASRGHTTMGGYDNFKSYLLPDGGWSKPRNLGHPSNSPGDDIYYVQIQGEGEKEFYFTSYRKGGVGEKDLYYGSFVFIPDEFVTIVGIVVDEVTGDTIPAELTLKEVSRIPMKIDSFGFDPRTMRQYEREVKGDREYELIATAPGYIPYREVMTVLPSGDIFSHAEVIRLRPDSNAMALLKGIVVDSFSRRPLKANLEIVEAHSNAVVKSIETTEEGKFEVQVRRGVDYKILASAPIYDSRLEGVSIPQETGDIVVEKEIELVNSLLGKTFLLNNIYFDHDKYTLRSESIDELERLVRLLEKYPTMEIEIAGHTDSNGSDAYNIKLSHNRARVVVDYLIEGGIAKERLTFQGYGERRPIDTNETAEGRQRNRRTEFTVMAI